MNPRLRLTGGLRVDIPKITTKPGFAPDVFTGDKTAQLRGGAGVFTGRVPFVWPGGMFVNNGATVGLVSGTTLPNGAPARFCLDFAGRAP